MNSTQNSPDWAPRGGRLLSAGLNLCLLLGLSVLALWRRPDQPLPAAVLASESQLPVQTEAAASWAVPAVLTNVVPFHWGQLESSDFRVYVKNLEAVGCPRGIMEDLVFFELERLYAERALALPQQDVFWKSRALREVAEREREEQLRQLHEEKRAAMEELVGVYWNEEAYEFWYEDSFASVAEVLAGFLTDRRVLQAVAVFQEGERALQEAKRMPKRIHGVNGAEAVLAAAYEKMMRRFAGLMSPAELEEFALRVVMMDAFDHEFDEEVRLSGQEMREIARLRRELFPPFAEPLDLFDFHGADDEEKAKEELLQARICVLLGQERCEALERSQDYRYRQIRAIAKESNLSEQSRLGAWQVCRAADEELERLARADDLSPDQLRLARQAVRGDVQDALQALLGEDQSRELFKRCGHWLPP